MIFVPYADESKVIQMIHKVRNVDYALLRLTYTMIDKNNLDANGIFRDLLERLGIVDYATLDHGGRNAVTHEAIYVQSGKVDSVELHFYRVSNKRGDRRFSFEAIQRRAKDHELNEGDLLYISYYPATDGTQKLFLVNLTHNTPTVQELADAVGLDPTTELFDRIKPRLTQIINGGPYPNSKGIGAIAPKDVGDTLEGLLRIRTNNRADADIEGLIEVKAKGSDKTKDTLFTLRPNFEGTPIAEYEPNDKSRVNAFARYYGYDSEKHAGYSSLYITIGSKDAPQNSQGFYLEVDEDTARVNLKHVDPQTRRCETAAFWSFDDLKDQLLNKHRSTLWVNAKVEHRAEEHRVYFKFNEVEFSRAPQFTTFLSLIKAAVVTYDWRGYTSKTGKYKGKNHGNAWRIKPNSKTELFGEIETVTL